MKDSTHPINEFLGDHTVFLDLIFSLLKNDQINVKNYALDHICYRVETIDSYKSISARILEYAALLTESQIQGRSISTFKLHEPLQYQDRKIYLIELPSPKSSSPYPKGFEHVEFVVGDELFGFEKKHPQIDFITKGMTKKVNPDLRIQYEDCSVKFHEHHLEYVIAELD